MLSAEVKMGTDVQVVDLASTRVALPPGWRRLIDSARATIVYLHRSGCFVEVSSFMLGLDASNHQTFLVAMLDAAAALATPGRVDIEITQTDTGATVRAVPAR